MAHDFHERTVTNERSKYVVLYTDGPIELYSRLVIENARSNIL